MPKFVYILLPSAVPTGPVKGGIALANLLCDIYNVKLVFISSGSLFTQGLCDRVEVIYLSRKSRSNFFALFRYAYLLLSSYLKHQQTIVSISMCFASDLINVFMGLFSHSISSVRGNLFVNYSHTYLRFGIFLAYIHLFFLRFLDNVFVMSHEMYAQVAPFVSIPPILINNFIDEPYLECYRINYINKSNPLSIVFVGSLTSRKSPQLLLNTFLGLELNDVQLHFVGEGPLLPYLMNLASQHKSGKNVTFHGHVDNPYDLMASSDLFVLPSLSEGISRACLEALYLGIPCILKDVDANKSIITDSRQGALFSNFSELSSIIPDYLNYSRSRNMRSSLLGTDFTRAHALSLLSNHFSSF